MRLFVQIGDQFGNSRVFGQVVGVDLDAIAALHFGDNGNHVDGGFFMKKWTRSSSFFPNRLKLRGEVKTLTVFTSYSEKFRSEEMVNILNEYFTKWHRNLDRPKYRFFGPECVYFSSNSGQKRQSHISASAVLNCCAFSDSWSEFGISPPTPWRPGSFSVFHSAY